MCRVWIGEGYSRLSFVLHLVLEKKGMFALHLDLGWGKKHMNHDPDK